MQIGLGFIGRLMFPFEQVFTTIEVNTKSYMKHSTFLPKAARPLKTVALWVLLFTCTYSYAQKPDFKKFNASLKSRLAGKCIGWGFMICDSMKVVGMDMGGYERMPQDPPAKAFSIWDPMNPASICKTITGVAMLRLLHDRNIPVTNSISAYLPKNWKQGYGISGITFAQLMRHESGLRDIVFWLDYDQLRKMVENGISTDPDIKKYKYQNSNFALMRILIACLFNHYEKPDPDQNIAWGQFYENYVNYWVFNKAGIPNLTCKPDEENQNLAYQYPDKGQKGGDFGDWTKYNGGAGWNISVAQFSMFLRNLMFTEKLLTKKDRQMMLDNQYSLDQTGYTPTLHTKFYRKNGGFPAANNPGGMNSEMWIFNNGITVVLYVNSDVAGTDNVNDIIYKAYEDASK